MRSEIKALMLIILSSIGLTAGILAILGLKNLIYPLLALAGADSINPCTFVIYTMLLIALSLKENISKRRIYAVGLAFVAAVYISYYLLGIGLVILTKTIPVWVAGVVSHIQQGSNPLWSFLSRHHNILYTPPVFLGNLSGESKSISQRIVQKSRELSMIAGTLLLLLGIYVILGM
ncbi:MAG: cytochrome c-type biosis protein [Thermococcaceae archaeon]|nr:cytochrome c-type biosis protein [Thermococcaceae archaeon]